jgi:Ribonuclease H2 non-catalytic subunit (Ylr154p-like)
MEGCLWGRGVLYMCVGVYAGSKYAALRGRELEGYEVNFRPSLRGVVVEERPVSELRASSGAAARAKGVRPVRKPVGVVRRKYDVDSSEEDEGAAKDSGGGAGGEDEGVKQAEQFFRTECVFDSAMHWYVGLEDGAEEVSAWGGG